MTKQFVSEARGSVTPSVRIINSIKYAQAGHIIFYNYMVTFVTKQSDLFTKEKKETRLFNIRL